MPSSLSTNTADIKNRILSNFSIGMVGSLVGVVIGLCRTAVLTKNIALEDYGRFLIAINFFPLLNVFLGVRIKDFLFRFYPEYEQKDLPEKVNGILFICLVICLFFGLLLLSISLFLSGTIADFIYKDDSLAALFLAAAPLAFLHPFEEFAASFLRIKNKFSHIIIPNIFGLSLGLFFILYQVVFVKEYSLYTIVLCHAVGVAVGFAITIISAARKFSVLSVIREGITSLRALKSDSKKIGGTLFHTNLTGYIKLASEEGGFFLLGILGGPAEAAIYGIARQLLRPLRFFERNLSISLAPEITNLYASGKIQILYRLVRRHFKLCITLGVIPLIIAIICVKPVILLFTSGEYIKSLPTFYTLLVASYLTLSSVPFFTLALVMGRLNMRNAVVSLRIVFLGGACAIGLSSFTLAMSHLIGVLVVRFFNDLPLYKRLSKMVPR